MMPKPPAPRVSVDAYMAKIIRNVVRDGSWSELLPIAADGVLLSGSRRMEHAHHEVRLIRDPYTGSWFVGRCTGPCGMHRSCWHRVQAAVVCWQHDHPDWNIRALCNEQGEPSTRLIWTLIGGHLTMPSRLRRRFELEYAKGPEVRMDA